MKTTWTLAFLSLQVLAVQAACPSWPTAERFTLNGAEATDHRTGLVWARCSVGQSWSGSACTGTVSELTHDAALAHAQSLSGWRLPNVKELASLADKGCAFPSIDRTAFPGLTEFAPGFWTSTPSFGDSGQVWFVSFGSGVIEYDASRNGYLAVRLVRVSP